MLPPKRLELLLRQSVQLQVDKCPFHYTEKDLSCYSLLTDHICQRFVTSVSQFLAQCAPTLITAGFTESNTFISTVEPVCNGHPWNQQQWLS